MTIIAQDTFTRANTSANSNVALGWGTASDGKTWATTIGSGSYSILSNEGRITACTVTTFEQLGTGTIADCEVLARLTVSSTNYNMVGVTLRQTASNTTYRIRINTGNSAQGFAINKTVAGTATNIITTSFAPTLGTFYWIRGRVVGTSLYGKVWQDGTVEPAGWTLTATDTSIVGAGGYGLCCQSTASGDVAQFDRFSVDNLASVPTKDLVSRVRLLAQNAQDIGTRLRLQPNGVKNLATRLVLRTPSTSRDLNTRLNVKPQVVSTQDASIYKTQIVKAYTAAGVFIDVVRDAPLLTGFKEAVNTAISPLQVVLPRKFDDFDLAGAGGPGTIAQGNEWYYIIHGPGLPVDGKVRYRGVVDAFEPSIDDSGAETVTVTLTPKSSAIADHGIGGTQAFTSTDPVSVFNWWFTNNDSITGNPYAYPLTLDGTNPASSGVSISYPFVNENLASIFVTIVQMLPANWFVRFNTDLTTTLNTTPLTAQHSFYLGADCALLKYKQDWTGLKNVIYAIGGTPAGFGQESITPVSSPGTGNGLYNAVFQNSHTGTWNVKVDPSFTILATGPAIAAGVQTVTPSSMTNIVRGVILRVAQGTGAAETVTVSSVTSSTFTATFANTHSGTYTITLDSTFVVSTTCSTPIGGGGGLSAWVPASGTNIVAGAKYLVDGGTNQTAITSTATGSDIATFGERLLLVTDTRVADQHSLDVLAQGLLGLLDQVVIRTKVRIIDYRGDTQFGLGSDIETIQAGDSCKIIAPNTPASSPASLWDTAVWGSSSWDFTPGTAFGQIAVITALTYNFDSVDLEISTLQPNQDAVLIKLRNTLQDFTIGAQST